MVPQETANPASEPVPSLNTPISLPNPSPTSSIGSFADDPIANTERPSRPRMTSRRSSGTMIIPRDSPKVELNQEEEEYEPDDVRSMSPKRSMADINKLGEDARHHLIEQAKALQASLLAIVDRVETVKVEHEKLEGGNKFLQSYIGELIQTSKITSAKSKGKGRGVK